VLGGSSANACANVWRLTRLKRLAIACCANATWQTVGTFRTRWRGCLQRLAATGRRMNATWRLTVWTCGGMVYGRYGTDAGADAGTWTSSPWPACLLGCVWTCGFIPRHASVSRRHHPAASCLLHAHHAIVSMAWTKKRKRRLGGENISTYLANLGMTHLRRLEKPSTKA
jgi:hypothetical protein